jgi:ubiquinone/menaquinone biosynthesis C-methylase UbiE
MDSRLNLWFAAVCMDSLQAFYDARAAQRHKELARRYQLLLRHYYRFLVPPDARVLELGCSSGELLAAVQPALGVGIDFSPAIIEQARKRHPHLEFHVAHADRVPVSGRFDYILLSDLVNDLSDVQHVLATLQRVAHPQTRLVLNFFNQLWRPVLALAEKLGAKAPTPQQNWLAPHDMRNLLHLAGWEWIREEARILWPIRTPLLEPLLNRWIAPWFRPLCLTRFMVARPRPRPTAERPHYRCTVVVPARNEAGNIEPAIRRIPEMGLGTEILFIEGHSRDNTWETLELAARQHPERNIRLLKQQSRGKGGAVREAFAAATGDILFILDADLTMPPEDLPKFYEVLRSGTAEFVNGVRLVYPMENEAMRFLNMLANKSFSMAFSWLLAQPVKDTLCGTKVLFRHDYDAIARNRAYFGDFDPFGDFDLLFGAAKLNLRIVDLPIRYRARTYGDTNIQRWRHGWLLLRMVWFAARRLKFI